MANGIKLPFSIPDPKSAPKNIWGPPSPDQSWDDYADKVTQDNAANSLKPKKNSIPQINETKPLERRRSTRKEIDDRKKEMYEAPDPVSNLEGPNPINWATEPEVLNEDAQQKYEQVIEDSYDSHGGRDFTGPRIDAPKTTTNSTNPDMAKSVDDGYTDGSENGLWMTGEQYKKYAEAGFGGRSIEDIIDSEIYNKDREFAEFGFIPYVVEENATNFNSMADMQRLSDMWTTVGKGRELANDFTINYDGKQFSGRDFLENIYANNETWNNQWSNPDQYAVKDKAYAKEDSVPMVYGYSVNTDEQEDPMRILADVDANASVAAQADYPGQYPVVFTDGTTVVYDSREEANASVVPFWEEPQEGEDPNAWGNFDTVTLDNGITLNSNDAKEIYNNLDQYSDYGLLNKGKPSFRVDGIDDAVPYLSDLVTNSASFLLSRPTRGISYLASNGPYAYIVNRSGMDPTSYNPYTGTYSRVAEDVDDEQVITNTAGYLLQPLAEELGGKFGAGAKVIKLPKSEKPLLQFGQDVAVEAGEEVPGNLFEEMARYPLSEMFADPILNEEGKPILDNQGKELRDPDTPFQNRVINFGGGIPEAAGGGAALAALLGFPGFLRNQVNYSKNNKNGENQKEYKYHIPSNTEFDYDEVINQRYRNAEEDNA